MKLLFIRNFGGEAVEGWSRDDKFGFSHVEFLVRQAAMSSRWIWESELRLET